MLGQCRKCEKVKELPSGSLCNLCSSIDEGAWTGGKKSRFEREARENQALQDTLHKRLNHLFESTAP